MRFMVDESGGAAISNHLKAIGHDVVDVGQVMPGAEDQKVLAAAFADGRILVTNDKDFGKLVFRSGLPHAGILLLRLQNESADNRLHVLNSAMQRIGANLAGSFTVATERSIRVRRP
jgi:predicted nuclease of predicted toxin-antitoxin system